MIIVINKILNNYSSPHSRSMPCAICQLQRPTEGRLRSAGRTHPVHKKARQGRAFFNTLSAQSSAFRRLLLISALGRCFFNQWQ
jgi:hypothetical protein